MEQTPAFSASGLVDQPDRWWTAFGDSELNLQIERSLVGNFTLAGALQRLRAAEALTRREASDLWPDLNGIAEIGGTVNTDGPDRPRYVLGFGVAYQVDLWGQIRSRVEAERLRTSATLEDYHAVALALSAEVARTWYFLIEAHAQRALLDEQLETNRTGVELQEARFELGQIRLADVLRQRQLLESTYEQITVVEARIEVLEHLLAILQGDAPQEADYLAGRALPALPPLPYTGLPSDLLNRRPDIRREYLELWAADRDLASAISAQYPRVDLTGSVLSSVEHPENLLRDWIASISGQLVAPLFDGGQRRAEVDRTAAVVRERFTQYSQTVLEAFREVEDALARERYQQERILRLEAQLDFAGKATDRLREQYLIGDTDFLNVLSATTDQQRLQRQTLAARLDLVLNRIALYLALAGSFETGPGPAGGDPPENVSDE